MANELFFSPRMKMAQLIELDYRLLFILPRFGICLGFGERSVGEVCTEAGVPVDLFLLVCDIYANDIPEEGSTPAGQIDPDGLVRYLHNSHSYYINERIPALDSEFAQTIAPLKDPQKQILVQFYENYRRELLAHFEYEEQKLFPYVISVVRGDNQVHYSIHEFEKNHSNIEEKLDDLKNIIIKYLPETASEHRNMFSAGSALLVDLFRLGDDLLRHTYIEDHVLVPLVTKLEKR